MKSFNVAVIDVVVTLHVVIKWNDAKFKQTAKRGLPARSGISGIGEARKTEIASVRAIGTSCFCQGDWYKKNKEAHGRGDEKKPQWAEVFGTRSTTVSTTGKVVEHFLEKGATYRFQHQASKQQCRAGSHSGT